MTTRSTAYKTTCSILRLGANCAFGLLVVHWNSVKEQMFIMNLPNKDSSHMHILGFMTGKADDVTDRVAHLYAEETDEKLERILSLIEPALVTVLAVIIGCILLTVMLPLAGVMSSFL